MNEWKQHVIGAIVTIIVGVGLLLWANSIEIPASYKTFLGIPYGVNPEYFFVLDQLVTLLVLGLFLLGAGAGMLSNTYTIYKLEKKLASHT